MREFLAAVQAEIKENRLRVVEARGGEDIAQLIERTGCTWTPEQSAVANSIEVDTPLTAGQLIKISRPETYRSRSDAS